MKRAPAALVIIGPVRVPADARLAAVTAFASGLSTLLHQKGWQDQSRPESRNSLVCPTGQDPRVSVKRGPDPGLELQVVK